MQTVPEQNPAVNDDRIPTKAERVRLALARAGANGLSTAELARELHGADDHTACYRIVQLVARLRRRGVRVWTVWRVGYKGSRYFLGQFPGANAETLA
jgi:hypothetical protein